MPVISPSASTSMFKAREVLGSPGISIMAPEVTTRKPARDYGTGAVGDIGKRSAMNERGRAFGGLHEVREKGFVEQGHHRADNSKVCRADRLERRFA